MIANLDSTLAARQGAIGNLCRMHGVVALDVFGSAADGRFDAEASDYDFIARFEPGGNISLGRRFVAFAEALEGLLGRHVDLITDHPIANPYLRRAIETTRRPLYVKSPAKASA